MIPDCPLRQDHSADRPSAIPPAVIKRVTPALRTRALICPLQGDAGYPAMTLPATPRGW